MKQDLRVELAGRSLLTAQLLAGGWDVATPIADEGIDLIAFLSDESQFRSVPIQLKANTAERFGLDQKYKKISQLRIVYVWFALDPHRAEIYSLSYDEAYSVLKLRGATETKSWIEGFSYTYPSIPSGLREELNKYRMSPETWRQWKDAMLSS